MNPIGRSTLAVAVLVIALVDSLAFAYERTPCKQGEKCKTLKWSANKIRVYLNQDFCSAPPQRTSLLTREEALCTSAVADGLSEWNKAACSDEHLEFAGTTAREDLGYDPRRKDNLNLIIWAQKILEATEEPPKGVFYDTSAVIALTTATYDANTGRIVDMDMELNGEYFTFDALGCEEGAWAPGVIDLQSVITHESGHFLGLADLYSSEDQEFTMYGRYEEGQDPCAKRTLAQDDIDGLCAIYPREEQGCSNSGGAAPGSLLLLVLLLAWRYIPGARSTRSGRRA